MNHRDPRKQLTEDIAALCARLMIASAVIGLVVGFFMGVVLL